MIGYHGPSCPLGISHVGPARINQSIDFILRGEHVTVSETDDPVALYKIKLKK